VEDGLATGREVGEGAIGLGAVGAAAAFGEQCHQVDEGHAGSQPGQVGVGGELRREVEAAVAEGEGGVAAVLGGGRGAEVSLGQDHQVGEELGVGIPFGPVFWSVDSNSLIGTIGAAVIGLTLHQAAYAAEIVRGGVIAVDHGQLEAAAALGIPRLRQIRRIVLPQAMRAILPTAGNEIIGLLKGTSVVYVMSIGELFYQVQVIYGRNGRVIPLLLVATAWYVVLTSLLSIAQYYVERRYARGANRTPPPTPLQRARRFVGNLRAAAAQRNQSVVPLKPLGDSR
jgi:ABC-type proline/glycine betaine transport system permease subunit